MDPLRPRPRSVGGRSRRVPRRIGSWFGTGPDRGLALAFVVTALVGLLVTVLASISRPYRRLSAAYWTSAASVEADHEPAAEVIVSALARQFADAVEVAVGGAQPRSCSSPAVTRDGRRGNSRGR
jgi:hypothetical protein